MTVNIPPHNIQNSAALGEYLSGKLSARSGRFPFSDAVGMVMDIPDFPPFVEPSFFCVIHKDPRCRTTVLLKPMRRLSLILFLISIPVVSVSSVIAHREACP